MIEQKTIIVTLDGSKHEIKARRIEAIFIKDDTLVFTEAESTELGEPDNTFYTELPPEVIDALQRPKPCPWHCFEVLDGGTWPAHEGTPEQLNPSDQWATIDEKGHIETMLFDVDEWNVKSIIGWANPADLKPQWRKDHDKT